MAAVIIVKPAELTAKGQQLASEARTLQGELQTVSAIADPSGIFESAASVQYQEVFLRWKTSQQQMLESLHDLGVYLQNASAAIEGVDNQLKAALGIT
ncbi:MAG: WXG100 family type VII secretion target [Actinomycetota bacterium]|nr:WXG100 family type VII secretion target [Actinomycetota bacterium]